MDEFHKYLLTTCQALDQALGIEKRTKKMLLFFDCGGK